MGRIRGAVAYRAGLARRAALSPLDKQLDKLAVRRFAQLYHRYPDRTWLDTHWLGHRIWKLPADVWVYQEIIHGVCPDLIIEAGTAEGGSAFYMATLLDILGQGEIITIDIKDFAGRPEHDRITYIRGSSVDDNTIAPALERAASVDTVMVILDSDHSRDHVHQELNVFGPVVTPGSYMIVEDGNVNGHPVRKGYGPGPTEALERWLPQHPEFEVDRSREKFFHTFNPGGYLRRRA
jgi:cephalosporin hydroxylase